MAHLARSDRDVVFSVTNNQLTIYTLFVSERCRIGFKLDLLSKRLRGQVPSVYLVATRSVAGNSMLSPIVCGADIGDRTAFLVVCEASDGIAMPDRLEDIFDDLTERRHEALVGIADNLTSKEIAAKLSISPSAVNHRIESVRAKIGSPPRSKLAREYRRLMEARTCKEITGDLLQLSNDWPIPEDASQEQSRTILEFSDSAEWPSYDTDLPKDGPKIVPRLLDGDRAGQYRVVAIVVLAVGLLAFVLIALGVAQALTELREAHPKRPAAPSASQAKFGAEGE